MTKIQKLHNRNKKDAAEYLSTLDPHLKKIIAEKGLPKIYKRPEGFETLVNIIVEQMLSVKAAETIFKRFKEYVKDVTPKKILSADTEMLRNAGLSYSKIKYIKNIAESVVKGELDFDQLSKMDNNSAQKKLTSIKGIGDWTANIYLMFSLQRADIWPYGDIALAQSVKKIKGFNDLPDKKKLIKIGDKYKPWRTMAALIFWSTYN